MKLLHFAIFLGTATLSLSIKGQTPCVDGLVNDTYPCNQTRLMSHLTPTELGGEELNDIWGWTDTESGKEYALVGLTDGVTFVDISAPTAPVVLGKLEEPESANNSRLSGIQHGKSAWRDLKVYKDHVFVVSDNNAQHGMQVFDLTRLREFDGSTFQSFDADGFYSVIGSSHNVVINEATGFAYIVGTKPDASVCGEGGLHIVNIQDPKNPIYENCFDDDGYTHDAQCIIYEGPDSKYSGREICFNSNVDTFTIVDVDDKNDMSIISRSSYDRVEYTHQGWLTEDQRFYLMNDENDEDAHGFNPRTLIWDIQDLENPVMIGEYYNVAVSIDHNLYTHLGMAFESNYTSGLRVLDLSNVDQGVMRELAFFDTFPSENSIVFAGNWSNYPYFESGNIILSDIENGLFVVQLDLKTDPIANHPKDTMVCEGAPVTFRINTSSDDLEYKWQRLGNKRFADMGESVEQVGTETNTLQLDATDVFNGAQFRCKVTDSEGNIFYSFPSSYDTDGMGAFPIASFSSNQNDQTVTFTNESTDGETYLWDFGDGNVSSDENPTHIYANINTFVVKLTVTNDCGSDTFSSEQNLLTGGTLANISLKNFDLYPNPASGFFTLKNHDHHTLELKDLSGKLVLKSSLSMKETTIPLKEISKGVYLVTLIGIKSKETLRLIVK
ncbi:MAG: choice-of-anchor B family protein [Cyclobacteriaceae bacterium]